MERTRLAGTAKEAVLLALWSREEFVPVREVIETINRKGIATSVPAVYRALALLEQAGFIVEGDPKDNERAIRQFSQRRAPGTKERTLLHYRLTDKGVAMSVMLKLGKSTSPISARNLVKASHLMYAALAESDSTPSSSKVRR